MKIFVLRCLLTLLSCLLTVLAAQDTAPTGPHQANGIKIGEVRADRAIVWLRATREPERRMEGPEFDRALGAKADPFPEGSSLADMRHSVPGAPAEVRVVFWPADEPDARRATEWEAVEPAVDFTHRFALDGLAAGTAYEVRSEARAGAESPVASTLDGRFRTAPAADDPRPVTFTVVTGQDFHRRDAGDAGHAIYPLMKALAPDFFVHTGDIVYYDKPGPFARTVELARYKWNRIYALANQRAFHARTAAYFLRDDHDTLKDDCWPGQTYGELTWDDGLHLFREQTPTPVAPDLPYRTVRWGRDVQVWLLEGREFRSANRDPDGPAKTILGAEQLAWLLSTLRASDATFRFVISATPIVGPDRASKNDNHANAGFRTEGAALRRALAGLERTFVICGDRHWQYVSDDPETGLREFSCGPTSDAHAGGFPKESRPMHRYLRVKGGFLSVSVGRDEQGARAVFRHHDVTGGVRHEEIARGE